VQKNKKNKGGRRRKSSLGAGVAAAITGLA
jgi:hypothetical protein